MPARMSSKSSAPKAISHEVMTRRPRARAAIFVWLKRGKDSEVIDLATKEGRAALEALIAKADVLLQNLKPGSMDKLGFSIARLRKDYPALICCTISGYGDDGPYAHRKAYDLLIQADSRLTLITGGPEGPSRVGISVVDIGAPRPGIATEPSCCTEFCAKFNFISPRG
jgi:crotonobetainyl-CoA:carnitine CoA-transferase CaiB-like acyl-CoA transferase